MCGRPGQDSPAAGILAAVPAVGERFRADGPHYPPLCSPEPAGLTRDVRPGPPRRRRAQCGAAGPPGLRTPRRTPSRSRRCRAARPTAAALRWPASLGPARRLPMGSVRSPQPRGLGGGAAGARGNPSCDWGRRRSLLLGPANPRRRRRERGVRSWGWSVTTGARLALPGAASQSPGLAVWPGLLRRRRAQARLPAWRLRPRGPDRPREKAAEGRRAGDRRGSP